MKTKKNINLKNKKNVNKKITKKNLKVQEGGWKGYKSVKIKQLHFDFIVKFANNIHYNIHINSNPVNPGNIMLILNHLNSNENNYLLINFKKYYLKDLVLRKLRMNEGIFGRVGSHYFLMLYLKSKVDEKKYVLATFGGNGVTVDKNFVICFPDEQIDLYNIDSTNGISINIRVPSKPFNPKNDEVIVTNENIIYLLNIFYIYEFIQNKCPICKVSTPFTEDICISCNDPIFGYPIKDKFHKFDRLKYYKNIYDPNQEGAFNYYIMYGSFHKYAKKKSLNCQSFANFFINLMRGNPFRYSTRLKVHTVVERRLLVMKYLFEINFQFMEENKNLIDGYIIPMFNLAINNYNSLLSKLRFDDYLIEDDTADSKLHTISNRVFKTTWWLLRFMRKHYEHNTIPQEVINEFDQEFDDNIKVTDYEEDTFLNGPEIDEDPVTSDDDES